MAHLKSLVATASVAVLAMGALGACGSNDSSGSGDASKPSSVLFGIIDDFTGPSGSLGQSGYQGAELAANQINAEGGIKSLGGAKIELKKYDTATDPNQAVPQANKLVQDGAVVAIGGHVSDTVIAGSNVTHRAHVPWIDTEASATKVVTRQLDDVFQMTPNALQYGETIAAIMKSAVKTLHLPGSGVGMSYSETSFGEDARAGFLKGAEEQGLDVQTDVGYPLNTANLLPVAQRMQSTDPQILFNSGYPADGVSMAKIFNQTVQTNAKVYVSYMGADSASQLKDTAEGAITYAAPGSDFANMPAQLATVTADFNKAYNTTGDMSTEAVYGYMAVMMARLAIETAASTDGTKVASALHTVKMTHDQGNLMPKPTFAFAPDGSQADASVFMCQVQKGKTVGIWPEANASAPIIAYGG